LDPEKSQRENEVVPPWKHHEALKQPERQNEVAMEVS
jgi:hypothetical protein